MCKLKVGDVFEIISDAHEDLGAMVGDVVTLLEIHEDNCHAFKHEKISHPIYYFLSSLECIVHKYKSSNRYKLKQAIKETGFSSRKLSHFAVGNESFFYNQTGPARFKEYGDISSSKLDSMLVLLDVAKINLNAKITQDAFDEREKLDLAAKTVDENNVPLNNYDQSDDEVDILIKECNEILKDFNPEQCDYRDSLLGNSDQEDYSRYVDQLQSQAIKKRNNNVRNFMMVLVVFLILLAFYFLQK